MTQHLKNTVYKMKKILLIGLVILGMISCQSKEITPSNEVKYFRLKVVNKDGSIQYITAISNKDE